MARDPRETFVSTVKRIDPIFKRGDLEAFWPRLRALIRLAPERADVSRKKSHYLVSLAWRSILRKDTASARRFLDFADRHVDPDHLTPYFLRERAEYRRRVEAPRPGHGTRRGPEGP